MKKAVVPRIFGIMFLYPAIFGILVVVQFAKQGSFTQKLGSMVLSGQFKTGEDTVQRAGVYSLEGAASVFFGGLEFLLAGGDEGGLTLIGKDGTRLPVFADTLHFSGETARFALPGGTELVFSTQYVGGRTELRVGAVFEEALEALELPFKPLRTSRIRNDGDQITVAAGGQNYRFDPDVRGAETGVLTLAAGGPGIAYSVIPEKRAFSPDELIDHEEPQNYDEAVARWQDQVFSLWNSTAASAVDEDTVIAYAGEAIRRGSYRAAVSAIPQAFLDGPRRTYESSVYLGRMEQAHRSFVTAEREKISRLSRQINEKSLDFLKESHVFEFLGVRGYLNFMNDALELVRAIDPAALELDAVPGILEGALDIRQYRSLGDNPFGRLTDQACFVISENIHKFPEGNLVLVFRGGTAGAEFNLRLGKSLAEWAQAEEKDDWAALGRAIILSVLSLTDENGEIPASFRYGEDGTLKPAADEDPLQAAHVYRLLAAHTDRFNGNYPRALNIGAAVNGIWAWTAASAVNVTQEGNMLDIAVSFPLGETHYMMIRGIRPFSKVQLYGIDYRTDPQFERYDSSGWVYHAPDQLLLLKMKHRAGVEHVRIYY